MDNAHPVPPPPDHLSSALEVAAQCWCDATTEHLVTEPALAEAFARPVAGVAGPDTPGRLTIELPDFLRARQRKLF